MIKFNDKILIKNKMHHWGNKNMKISFCYILSDYYPLDLYYAIIMLYNDNILLILLLVFVIRY